jgi:GGDEF domain-containing protein
MMKMTTWGQGRISTAEEVIPPNPERCLTLLVDGAARGAVEVDPDAYKTFRARLEDLARKIPDRLPEEEKLALIGSINKEFDGYRTLTEDALRDRQVAWRSTLQLLFDELVHDLGLDTKSTRVASLLTQLKHINATGEINGWREALDSFLHPLDGTGPSDELAARLRSADSSTANDNATGLFGGGAAVEQLRKIMQKGNEGYIVLFRLSCMDIVNQRFGAEAVQDCLMAVSAFLTAGLESNDTIYHWSDSALLAIMQGRPNEAILTAELERIISQNRESTIKIAGRAVMLRIPITFQITPINRLRSPEDVQRITARPTAPR